MSKSNKTLSLCILVLTLVILQYNNCSGNRFTSPEGTSDFAPSDHFSTDEIHSNCNPIDWSEVNYFYRPESITDSTDRFITKEGADPNILFERIHFFSANLGADVFDNTINWQLGDFTGLYPTESSTQITRGHKSYGASAFQFDSVGGIESGSLGWMLNSFGLPASDDPNDRFVNAMIRYLWSFRTIHPWSSKNSHLGMEFSIQIPTAYRTSEAHSYVTAEIAIHDGTDEANRRYFWFQPVVFMDGFSPGQERIDESGLDAGTGSFWINPKFKPGCDSKFITSFENTSTGQKSSFTQTQTWTGWKWFALTISRTQLLNAVKEINQAIENYNTNPNNSVKKEKFSSDPNNYFISLMSIQSEINRNSSSQNGQIQNAHIGLSVKQLYLYELK